MAATGPYILHKSTQLCFAVRSNVNFDQMHPSVLSSKLAMKFNFPDGANTLPPRINLKVLSTAINIVCEKVRVEREKFVIGRQSGKHMRRRSYQRHHGLKSRPRDSPEENNRQHIINSTDVALLSAGGFFWTKERITDQDLINCTKNLKIDDKDEMKMKNEKENETKKWEVLSDHENMSVFRRQMETGIYEYKVFGSFFDINARSFFTIQIDTEYRKVWDSYAAKLDIIDKDPESDCEVLHWIMKYPYPLRSRDYVMIRRSKVDEKEKKIVLISKATSHPQYPENQEHVRVNEYASQMVIKPHRTFDELYLVDVNQSESVTILFHFAASHGKMCSERTKKVIAIVRCLPSIQQNGMDFVLSCYDNPRVTIPSVCTNYATASGIPDYIKTLHLAASNIQPSEDLYSCEKNESSCKNLIMQDTNH